MITVNHKFISAKPEQTDPTIIGPNEWNDFHTVVDNTPSYNVVDYNFSRTPGGNLIIGSNAIILNPIPQGIVNGNYLCISGGTGASEAVQITSWNSTTGQVIVTCANTHSGAWTISSGSSGIQEAMNVAFSKGGGTVLLPPGTTSLCATIIVVSGIRLIGCGIYMTVLKRTADYGDTFTMIQKVGCYFSNFMVQHYINYQSGTPGTIINKPTRGNHFTVSGCNSVIFDNVRFETMPGNVSVVGGADIYFRNCQFYGIWDGRSGSPQVTQYNVTLQCDPAMGIPTYVGFYGCIMTGNSNGTTNSPTNYNAVGAAFGYLINGCEDLEIIGGSTGGCNNNNLMINPSASTTICAMIRVCHHKFDSAGFADFAITKGDATKNVGVVQIDDNIFNGELAGQYGLYIQDNGVGNTAIVQDLQFSNNTVFGYYQSAIQIADGNGINISDNKIYCYNLAKNTSAVPLNAAGIAMLGRARNFSIRDNILGGSLSFSDYDNVNNCCLYGIYLNVPAAQIRNIHNNNTFTPNSIGILTDDTFIRSTVPLTYANLPLTPQIGWYATVTDATTNTWGAIITAGGGTFNVLAFYNGTNWTVAGK